MTEVLTYKSRNGKKGGRHSCVLQRARRYQVASVSEIKILGSAIQTNGGTKQPCEQPAWYRYNVTQVLQWNYNIIPRSSSSRSRANIGYVDRLLLVCYLSSTVASCVHRKKRVRWSESERSTSASGDTLNVTDLRRRRIALGVLLCSLQYCQWLKPWKIGSFISLLETPTDAGSRLEKHFRKGGLFSISFYVSFLSFSLMRRRLTADDYDN